MTPNTTFTIPITSEESGERIDALLARALPNLSRCAAQRLLEAGAARLFSGEIPHKNYRARAGDTLFVTLPSISECALLPEDIALDIVYEDADVAAVNKPRGMVVHPAPGHPDGTLVNALLHHCGASLAGVGGEKRPGIVHRIDKDTSGLLLAAKNDFAHRALSAQLKAHNLSRVYEAVVVGNLREDRGVVDAPIGRDPRERKKMAVTEFHSRPAVTHWEVLARYPGYTHIRCRLETGRTHQIRVHMAHIGHPLLGDTVYGRKKPELGIEGQCLHAKELTFTHPRTGEAVHLTTQLPGYFEEALERLKKL
ncbi:MAG: RluA family pseudouridine synthase [Firmicutes bacterium]|nr:RluA family pseudouridine synthase [Bacillota bacterium]